MPLVIQDRVFQDDSKLWYPAADIPVEYTYPDGTQPPLWIPKLTFGNDDSNPIVMTVNGRTWPKKVRHGHRTACNMHIRWLILRCAKRVLFLAWYESCPVCVIAVCLQTLAPDTYRLRLLNGCNSRVLQLKFARWGVGHQLAAL